MFQLMVSQVMATQHISMHQQLHYDTNRKINLLYLTCHYLKEHLSQTAVAYHSQAHHTISATRQHQTALVMNGQQMTNQKSVRMKKIFSKFAISVFVHQCTCIDLTLSIAKVANRFESLIDLLLRTFLN